MNTSQWINPDDLSSVEYLELSTLCALHIIESCVVISKTIFRELYYNVVSNCNRRIYDNLEGYRLIDDCLGGI